MLTKAGKPHPWSNGINCFKEKHADSIIKKLNDEILRLTQENKELRRKLNVAGR